LQIIFILPGGRVPTTRSPVSGEKYHTKNSDEAQLEKDGSGKERNSCGQMVPNTVNAARPVILH
jgi:hypothetical protein